jgi:hypothetical protein
MHAIIVIGTEEGAKRNLAARIMAETRCLGERLKFARRGGMRKFSFDSSLDN